MGKVEWIDTRKLAQFILDCQDLDEGGIADRPGNMADVFHTFFGIGGLCLLGWFEDHSKTAPGEFSGFRAVDAAFALPADVVSRLGLKSQVLACE
mmetsp:Transcript_68270/g.154467  ORF Transcript_68270/g.154467 Transcript_68270/m.154467 type:complete len:95 (-) Transcript_68270:200-484(-)